MPNDKSVKPSIATYADHEVITPPNRLRDAVSTTANPTDDPVGRAERALALLSGEFSGWMDAECERLHAARGKLKAQASAGRHTKPCFMPPTTSKAKPRPSAIRS